jgi:hypothetical protein
VKIFLKTLNLCTQPANVLLRRGVLGELFLLLETTVRNFLFQDFAVMIECISPCPRLALHSGDLALSFLLYLFSF